MPLIRTAIKPGARFSVSSGEEARSLSFPNDIYVSTVRPVEAARIRNAPMVFVGYGVHAPEREWDDFKDVDLTGLSTSDKHQIPTCKAGAIYTRHWKGDQRPPLLTFLPEQTVRCRPEAAVRLDATVLVSLGVAFNL